ncbi:MAG: beta-lactamase [Gemmatimonadales bacterium]|nr:MAG: beta-lactamase [Gemmatimonadales bacterium]
MSKSAIVGLAFVIAARTLAAQDPGLQRLERELARIAALTDGKVGLAALHLETGRAAYLNPDEPFPMASTYKVPIAVELLTRVERGEVGLDTLIELRPQDLHPGSGTLTELFDDPGVILSLRNLLELMLLISDNSATDIVLRVAGGPQAVTQRMRRLGIDGIRVDRPTIQLIADWIGIDKLPPEPEWTPSLFGELARGVPDSVRAAAARRFDQDPRDTATPRAMTSLLAKIWRGEALGDSATALLLDIMRRSTTGAGRIKGMLHPDVIVSHKTGTIGGTTNDVGIITLPDGAGHVALSVFIKGSTLTVEQRERVIAHLARAVYDYFRFNPGG